MAKNNEKILRVSLKLFNQNRVLNAGLQQVSGEALVSTEKWYNWILDKVQEKKAMV